MLLLVVLAGCVGGTDTRPETAAYISQAILVPNCGRASCHSAATQSHNLAFDTVADSITAMKAQDGGRLGGALVQRNNAAQSELYQVIIGARKTMPPDAPLSDADIELIKNWIDDGAAGL